MRKLISVPLIVVLFVFAAGYAPARDTETGLGPAGIPSRSDSIAGKTSGGFDTRPDIADNYPGMGDVPDSSDEALNRWLRQRSTAVLRPGLAPGQSGTTGMSATAPVP